MVHELVYAEIVEDVDELQEKVVFALFLKGVVDDAVFAIVHQTKLLFPRVRVVVVASFQRVVHFKLQFLYQLLKLLIVPLQIQIVKAIKVVHKIGQTVFLHCPIVLQVLSCP